MTNVPNIFAIGDNANVGMELTPVAITAGRILARRLFEYSESLTDHTNVVSAVFTPTEYAFVGFSEEDLCQKYWYQKKDKE